MKAIWKFPLHTSGAFRVDMPKGAEVLSVGFQHEKLFLWAIVDVPEGFRGEVEFESEPRIFWMALTGQQIDLRAQGAKLIGRAGAFDDTFIVHVFDATEGFLARG
jgi:hypothetical protein